MLELWNNNKYESLNVMMMMMMMFQSSSVVKDFESVELGDTAKKQKVPRRTIYFASGETMEEFSTDEEDEEEEEKRRKQTVMSTIDPVCVCVRERESSQ